MTYKYVTNSTIFRTITNSQRMKGLYCNGLFYWLMRDMLILHELDDFAKYHELNESHSNRNSDVMSDPYERS